MPAPHPWLLLWARTMRQRRGAVLTLVLTLVVAGVLAASTMPVQLLPRIDYAQVRVIADLPGQSAEAIEVSLNAPLEEALAGVRGLRAMQSRSGDERSYIELFLQEGHDPQLALQEAMAAVQQAAPQLPAGMPLPRIFPVSTADEPALIVALRDGELPPWVLRERLRADLLPALRGVRGVAAIHVGRTEAREFHVDLDPQALALAGMSVSEVLALLRAEVGPPVHSTLRDRTIEVLGRHGAVRPDAERLRTMPLPLADGTRLPLQAVADVHPDALSEGRLPSRLDGRPAVLLEVMRDPGARSHEVAGAVRDQLSRWQERGEDRAAVVLHDDAFLTEAALRGLGSAALAGGLLASLLLLLALRSVRHLPAVLLLLPGTLAFAVILLAWMGLGLDLMTLTGLLFTIGLGLDYLVIFADRLQRERERASELPEGAAPEDRAFAAVAGPLLGALLTTLAAVLPFLLVQGPVAQLFAPMILSVVAASVASFLLAMLVLPAWGDSGAARSEGLTPSASGSTARALRTGIGALLLFLTPVGFAVLVLGTPIELLPAVDDGLVRVRVNVPAGQPLDEVDRTARRLEALLLELPDTEHVHTTVGGYVREGGASYRPGEINCFVRVTRQPMGDGAAAWVARARTALDELGLLHARTRWELPRIRGVRTSLEDDDVVLVLSHTDGDLGALREAAESLRRTLANVEGLGRFSLSRDGIGTRVVIEPREEALVAAGVSGGELHAVLRLAMEGETVGRWVERGEPRTLRVRFQRETAGRSTDIDTLPILATDTSIVGLGSLVQASWREEALHIERNEGLRVQRLRASRDGTASADATLRALEGAIGEAELDAAISLRVDGELVTIRDAMRTLLGALLLCMLGVLVVLHLQYGWLRAAFSAVLMLPLSAVGALALTALLGQPMGGLLLAGLLIAFGIIANGAILILSEAVERAGHGRPHRDQVREAASSRLRPIVLTVLTTSLGLSPLLVVGGGVSDLLQPLALAVIGALLLSVPLLHSAMPLLFPAGDGRSVGEGDADASRAPAHDGVAAPNV
ncbi:MAG: efflux RND transporter permease subunit [Deltaproteobacteria bacterium]|nr:MAG: efflux RND transporter permease subunit [Deltaproteobacteria bacterium]